MEQKENIFRLRLQHLQKKMKEKNIQWYLIPTADFHNSEYVNDYFKIREYYSGFTGSNGTLLISRDWAGLWTDGRYFIQAEQELIGTDIVLFKMGQEGVPGIQKYMEEHVDKNDTIGFDGRVVTAQFGQKLQEILSEKEVSFKIDEDLAGDGFENRPKLIQHGITILPDELVGENVKKKLEHIRNAMSEKDADVFVLCKLDDIMWLYNMRGSDINCNPVALSYTIVEKEQATLFIDSSVLTKAQILYFEENRICIKPYESFYGELLKISKGASVLFDMSTVNYLTYQKVVKEHKTIDDKNPTELLKAIKNAIEVENLREVYIRDSVAVTKFIFWLKRIVKEKEITEYDAAMYMDLLRKKIKGYLDLSFETISAYRENAAMMHYTATIDDAKILYPEGMLLLDSGGQYIGGTTDVTRTISLGAITEKEKEHYTATCIGMLNLLHASFLYGCTGRNLDILAREPLWEKNIDYKCGTGHGIGYMLNVHEGPQSIRPGCTAQSIEAVFEDGMLISNEPGVYIKGEYGIRIENIMLCRKGVKNEDGQFMYFEPLTFVPIDRNCMDINEMSERDRKRFNQYQKEVYEKISPYLTEEERNWLKEETKAL